MILRVSLVLVLFGASAFAVETPTEHAVRCATRLITVTGLAADATLELGGDQDVLITYDHDASRYRIFTKRGVFRLDKPLPQREVSFLVDSDAGKKWFVWSVDAGGKASSQSTQKRAHADVVADTFAPLDDGAWAMIARIVKRKAPQLRQALIEQRKLDAQKHMRSGAAMGHAEAYDACHDVGSGAIAAQIATVIDSKALAATPVSFAPYELVKRADHPEWRACTSTSACVVAASVCGWPDAIAKAARGPYTKWAKQRTEQINCDMAEDPSPQAICREGQCIDPAATPSPAWYACKADADCEPVMACDEPVALSSRAYRQPGVERWLWWRTVDGWDRCAEPKEVPTTVHAKCVQSRCELR